MQARTREAEDAPDAGSTQRRKFQCTKRTVSPEWEAARLMRRPRVVSRASQIAVASERDHTTCQPAKEGRGMARARTRKSAASAHARGDTVMANELCAHAHVASLIDAL